MEKVEFNNAVAVDMNTVNVVYKVGGEFFTLEWSNLHEGTGEQYPFFCIQNVFSDSHELELHIRQVLDEGEDGESAELYYLLRDGFDASCVEEVLTSQAGL